MRIFLHGAPPACLAWAVCAALAGLTGTASARDTNTAGTVQEAATLPQVTVAASGPDGSQDQALDPVNVLEGDELVQRAAGSLGETLGRQPGIRASHFGVASSRPVLRGLDGARVGVFSEGAELMDASAMSPDHAVAIEPMLARRIEVLRGPAALAYGGAAIGGVIDLLDERVPTRLPARGVEGSVDLRGNSASGEHSEAFGLTAGAGSFAIRAEGLARRAGDYAVGRGWSEGRRVDASQQRTETGSLGLSWIGTHGHLGLAYTRQQNRYGLPGHAHGFDGCHADGDRLHCTADDDHEHHAHGDRPVDSGAQAATGPAPWVDLRSNRWELRGEYREPFAGVARVRVRAGLTRYAHDEIEGGTVSTRFRNQGHEARIDLEHHRLAGWRGRLGLQVSQRDFAATGEEAYVQPTRTRRHGLFLIEERAFGPLRLEAGLRHDWQSVDAKATDLQLTHQGSSISGGAHWRFDPAWSLGLTLSRAQRLPVAEELFADGRHLATRTVERGNPRLRPETANSVDLTLRRQAGDTGLTLTAFRKRIRDYIHADTLDAIDGIRLIDYAQHDALFHGLEAELRRRLGPSLHATLFGDFVRARLAGGEGNRNLPRIPPARHGLRLDTWLGGWDASLEFYRVARQSRIDDFETATAGYNMLNLGASRSFRLGNAQALLYLAAENLGNVLAFSHSSYVKEAAPLAGRRVLAGLRLSF